MFHQQPRQKGCLSRFFLTLSSFTDSGSIPNQLLLGFLSCFDLIFVTILYLSAAGGGETQVTKVLNHDLRPFSYQKSFFDLWILSFLRFLFYGSITLSSGVTTISNRIQNLETDTESQSQQSPGLLFNAPQSVEHMSMNSTYSLQIDIFINLQAKHRRYIVPFLIFHTIYIFVKVLSVDFEKWWPPIGVVVLFVSFIFPWLESYAWYLASKSLWKKLHGRHTSDTLGYNYQINDPLTHRSTETYHSRPSALTLFTSQPQSQIQQHQPLYHPSGQLSLGKRNDRNDHFAFHENHISHNQPLVEDTSIHSSDEEYLSPREHHHHYHHKPEQPEPSTSDNFSKVPNESETTPTQTKTKAIVPPSFAPTKYDSQIEKRMTQLLSLCFEPQIGDPSEPLQEKLTLTNPWKYHSTKATVSIAKKPIPGTDLLATRGIGIIPYPPWDVFRVFAHPEARKIWDPQFEKVEVVEELTDTTQVAHYQFKGIGLVWGRDMCLLRAVRYFDPSLVSYNSRGHAFHANPDIPIREKFVYTDSKNSSPDPNTIIVAVSYSISHQNCPEYPKQKVRAIVDTTGIILLPQFHGDRLVTKMLYVAQIDLQGKIPTYVVNKVSDDQPMIIHNISKYLAKYPVPDIV